MTQVLYPEIEKLSIPVGLVESVQAQEMMDNSQTSIEKKEEGVSFDIEGIINADYIELLKAKIFKVWEYPVEAITKGYDGKVSISFELDRAGRLMNIGIVTSSGHYPLDSAAMGAIEQASPFGPFPADTKSSGTIKITAHFCYVLD